MTDTLGKALVKAGLTATVKTKDKYRILHIPTASFLMELDYFGHNNDIRVVEVTGKAKAGKIRDLYRTGKMVKKTVKGKTVCCYYFIADDLVELRRNNSNKNEYIISYKLMTFITLRAAEYKQTPISASEFDFILI